MMPKNLQGLHFIMENKERCTLRQEFVLINNRETIHLWKFQRFQILLPNASKQSIIKFSNGISAINKSWKVSVLK